MAFLNGIFGKPQQQQPTQVQHPNQPQNQQNNQQQPQNQQNSNGSAGPAGSQQTPANTNYQGNSNPANPTDPFMDLMQMKPEVQQYYQQQQETQSKGLFGDNFTPENVNKLVSQNNFTQSLDPQKMQAALGGDQNAFAEILNSVAQSAVSMSLQASRGMVEHGVNTGNERFGSTLDSRFRDFQMKSQTPQHEALKSPMGKAMHQTIAKQIATANPRMSADEVNAKAAEALQTFAGSFSSPNQSGSESQSSGPNWEAFLEPGAQ